jgi:hypothetical protein
MVLSVVLNEPSWGARIIRTIVPDVTIYWIVLETQSLATRGVQTFTPSDSPVFAVTNATNWTIRFFERTRIEPDFGTALHADAEPDFVMSLADNASVDEMLHSLIFADEGWFVVVDIVKVPDPVARPVVFSVPDGRPFAINFCLVQRR